MSRYRPPAEPSSPYITAAGFERLRAEYDHLWRERRPEVVRALTAAAAEGDRSENAEYIYRKKELREIDRRVGYLQRRIPQFKVVQAPPSDARRVFFGAIVQLQDQAGKSLEYRIVGADEIGDARGNVSIDSPLARALLKHVVGDVVQLKLPEGDSEFVVMAVRYPI